MEVFRAYPLIKIRPTIIQRAIRADSISINSILNPCQILKPPASCREVPEPRQPQQRDIYAALRCVRLRRGIWNLQDFDSVRLLVLMGGTPRSKGSFPRNSDSEILGSRLLCMRIGWVRWLEREDVRAVFSQFSRQFELKVASYAQIPR